jgi:Tol biopolymer transport system component
MPNRRRLAAVLLIALAGVLTTLLATTAGGAHPGGNGKLVFETLHGGQFDIYVMNPDGSDRVNLTNHPSNDRDASWSPDGTRIAFSSARDGDGDIYVMNADGTGVTRLTFTPGSDTDPSWSPDGTQIVFVSKQGGLASDSGESSDDIWVMNEDGSDMRRLTKNVLLDDDPAFSPDGTKIAFARFEGSGGFDVYVMDVDGRRQTRLTTAPGDDERPSWAPDGSAIVFSSQRNGGVGSFGGGTGSIYVMSPDGSGQQPLTVTGKDRDPTWSPDGSLVLFVSLRTGQPELFVVGADGSLPVAVTRGLGSTLEPDWQPWPPPPPADDCTIRGTAGDDQLIGGPGPDLICGYGGNDMLLGAGGADELFGGAGDDTLIGGRGRDLADGGPGLNLCRAETRVAC